jgi:hypothetical protein
MAAVSKPFGGEREFGHGSAERLLLESLDSPNRWAISTKTPSALPPTMSESGSTR